MVQWEDPAVETRSAIVGEEVMFLLLGVYGYVFLLSCREKFMFERSYARWEYLQSLDVEYAVIRGRLSFRWPLVSRHIFLVSFPLVIFGRRSHI
ncbi:hypothetical protein J3R82DRAFT_7871 [Butyriboletus roseoflavus]|nr:hypothetical protein J3R82DRAFT_7871 [Butyriboletus roseoflavus]